MQQKLYTEEQVRNAFIDGMKFIAVHPLKYEQDANEYMNSLIPIKLPSDNTFMNNEYVIINKTELEAKIAELEAIPMYEKQWEDLDSITSEIRALKQTLSQSTPLIPEWMREKITKL